MTPICQHQFEQSPLNSESTRIFLTDIPRPPHSAGQSTNMLQRIWSPLLDLHKLFWYTATPRKGLKLLCGISPLAYAYSHQVDKVHLVEL